MDFFTFDNQDQVLDGPFRSASVAWTICDNDPDAMYVDTLEDEPVAEAVAA